MQIISWYYSFRSLIAGREWFIHGKWSSCFGSCGALRSQFRTRIGISGTKHISTSLETRSCIAIANCKGIIITNYNYISVPFYVFYFNHIFKFIMFIYLQTKQSKESHVRFHSKTILIPLHSTIALIMVLQKAFGALPQSMLI